MRLHHVLAALATLALVSCSSGRPDASQPKIGNGEEVARDSAQTRAVVMLSTRSSSGDYSGFCTGTLLNDTTLITAMHCVVDRRVRGIALELPNGRYVEAVNAFYPGRGAEILSSVWTLRTQLSRELSAAYAADPTCRTARDSARIKELKRQLTALMGQLSQHDVALVVFPEGTGDAITGGRGYYGVATSLPSVGDEALLIGFGQSASRVIPVAGTCGYKLQGTGFGVKRRGLSEITGVSGSAVRVEGYPDRAAAAASGVPAGVSVSLRPGDSGGPWIECQGTACGTFRVFAVTSTSSFGTELAEGTGAPVTSSSVRQMFARAINCGGRGCAGDFTGSGVTPI